MTFKICINTTKQGTVFQACSEIDCMHWPWRNCPTAWRGMYTRGDQGHPTIILEVVASQELWIWHAFFGIPGSNNDINILQNSEVFDDVIKGIGPDTRFTVSGVEYRRGYYLVDGIYPQYSTLLKRVGILQMKKERNLPSFKKRLEKDIERCFGVLQQR
ncbi:uncharacterized protein LOC110866035 [Helianthus annuus]|uniref:uncharacterized protein LOC110866035 n=1 Tax=Helianthus annuus TaxID=4232 RepID=UPI000B8F2EED|nr:uncharacterized protein LOC110866035 [Helianthus annuus]